MDFDAHLRRFFAAPAEDLATGMAQSTRLSELIRHFGCYLFSNCGIEAWGIDWYQPSPRRKQDGQWQSAEFRVPGTTQMAATEVVACRKWIESELKEHRFNPPGQLLTGSSGDFYHVAVSGSDGRWLVVLMRQSVHALKEWYARWLSESTAEPIDEQEGASQGPKAFAGMTIPVELIRPFQRTMLTLAIQSFAGHARRHFELDEARTELYRDSLTGLYNSRYLELVLEMEVRRATRFGTRFCVLFVDVDSFKGVNDNHGHLTGSALLAELGAIIKDAVREVDVVARYGGDEFVLVLLGADPETGKTIAERVRERVEGHSFTSRTGQDVQVTVSIGLAAFPENAQTRDDLLRIADDTMYASKKSGKNRVTVYSSVPMVAGSGDADVRKAGDENTI